VRKVLVLVEGWTERDFVKKILADKLQSRQLDVKPILICTSKLDSGQHKKGGYVSYHGLKKQIQNLLRDSSAVCVSTMVDYYGLSDDCPGRANPSGGTARERALSVENAISADIASPKFKPYLSMHEYEALLFSEPQILAEKLGVPSATIISIPKHVTPEEINDGSTTSPSHRLESIYPNYPKIEFGYQIASAIGLEKMRAKCPHFNDWVTMLEHL